jgi:polyisoprenyl-phosphate glycosyltransferase
MAGNDITAGTPVHSVVVPVFNEEAGIDGFHARLSSSLSSIGEAFEVVYVDDGSTDGSWQRLFKIAASDKHVRAVRFSRNFGHQIAITAGQDRALGQTVITIDADLQDPPELIPEMISRWRDGADIVYAVRTERKGETAFKTASASLFYRVLRRLADVDMPVDVGDFRLLSRRAADALQSMPEQHRYVRGMVAWMGFETASVGYVRDPRTAGETKYPLGKMIRFAADGILAFSVRPLRIATWLGLLTSCAAFAYALWLIFARITGVIPSVDGWTSLMVLILLLAGVQLMTIGALGEYVGRIYTEVRHRPLYLVSETLGEGE